MKKTIKTLVILLTALTLAFASGLVALAETTPSADIYVTIADEHGKLALVEEKITVTDIDGDGDLTINDALYAAHEAKFPGGAAAGYSTGTTIWGLSLLKLWGVENGGSYGYYVNNNSAWSLTDKVVEGDYLNAFIYTNVTDWDNYSYFNEYKMEAETGKEIELTLTYGDYDEFYNPLSLPAKDATITLNGEKTEFKTDADGKVKITVKKPGTYTVSAVSDTQTLVPPVLVMTVTGEDLTVIPNTGDNAFVIIWTAVALTAALSVVLLKRLKKVTE